MNVRWIDEIKDFSFDVTHLPGSRNLTDPLSRRCFSDGADPAASTGDADAESQLEIFSRLGSDVPVPARIATIRARWAATRRAAAVAAPLPRLAAGGGGPAPPPRPGGGGTIPLVS